MSVQKFQAAESPVVKGSRDGLRIVLPVPGAFDDALDALSVNLAGAGSFFRGARAVIEPSRELTGDEQSALKLLLERHGVEMSRIRPVAVRAKTLPEAGVPSSEQALAVRKTVRSGQRIVFEGSVMVFGDVNPGGEIIATGDIAVFGSLRGTAHAGSSGDTRATVSALSLRPVQLRIADLIARAPDDTRVAHPEMARVKNGAILVEPIRSGPKGRGRETDKPARRR